ncbi:MAG: hypothetical protein IPJ30_12510 [Acidobacteria bacterium]|nr:hypothetical protein [Acidobacteriota bacterium]
MVEKKCHVIFVVEESKTNERHPEQFVADVVVRLGKSIVGTYQRRTVEIEKARGQSYARGPHEYTIRSGDGSSTGFQVNADDPRFLPVGRPQAYIFVPHSLHHFNRTVMERNGEGRPRVSPNRFTGFGIEYLDNMLGGSDEATNRKNGFDTRGLPVGSITALIGDSFTQKTRLGRAYLSQAFASVIDICREIERAEESPDTVFGRCWMC